MTTDDRNAATDALQAWCQSQGLAPHEAVQIVETFIARMIIMNATSQDNFNKKFELIFGTIHAYALEVVEDR